MSNFTPYDYCKDESGCFDEAPTCSEGGFADALYTFDAQFICPACIETVRARRVEELRAATEAGSRIATGEEIVQRAADNAIEDMRAWLAAREAQ